jgi:DNA-binding CsgD family transcriptional regulator
MTTDPLSAADAIDLLAATVELTARTADIERRRAEWLDWLLEQVGAEGGFWCWGRGHPLAKGVTPVSTVVRGFTSEEWFALASAGLSPEADVVYRDPYVPFLESSNLVCLSRSMVWSDAEWLAMPFRSETLQRAGFENWLIGVRYVGRDTWCCVSLHRRFGRPDFSSRDVSLVAVAVGGISWLSAEPAERIPAEVFEKITPRQRMVMLCLLDGLSRKQVAGRLGITINTVNDHVKCLFQQFDVSSVSELAARFLKSQ